MARSAVRRRRSLRSLFFLVGVFYGVILLVRINLAFITDGCSPAAYPNELPSMNSFAIRRTSAINAIGPPILPLSSLSAGGGSSNSTPPMTVKRCSLNFFGLPRSFKSMVLPSIVKNVLLPNAQYNCDVFVHYFHQSEEGEGRYNDGGRIDPTEILLLKDAVESTFRSMPQSFQQQQQQQNEASSSSRPVVVKFVHDTDEEFMKKRRRNIWRYKHAYDDEGNQLYFPWEKGTWDKASLENLVRQWHSIDAAFRLMDDHAKEHNIQYERVAMLRNDVMYLTPMDVMQLDRDTIDTKNNNFVVPPFANYPVNDRYVCGPYDAVKVWSTERFDLIEDRVQDPNNAGLVMHSELFMEQTIFPAMEKAGAYSKHVNPDICFARTRANSIVLIDDCLTNGETRGIRDIDRRELVQTIIGRKCSNFKAYPHFARFKYVEC